ARKRQVPEQLDDLSRGGDRHGNAKARRTPRGREDQGYQDRNPNCHPERSEGSGVDPGRSFAALRMTVWDESCPLSLRAPLVSFAPSRFTLLAREGEAVAKPDQVQDAQ